MSLCFEADVPRGAEALIRVLPRFVELMHTGCA